MKKFISFVTAFVMVFVMMLYYPKINTKVVNAANSNYSFSRDGTPGQVMVNAALAQYGRTGNQLGYTYDWCAAFISDIAAETGQSDAISWNSWITGLESALINAGGEYKTGSPQVGDIAFINWNYGSTPHHVEIVYDVQGSTIYTIGGNSGPNATNYSV